MNERLNRRSLCLLLAASALAACSDDVVGPQSANVAGIVLSEAGAPLTSLGDTAILSTRVMDTNGKAVEGVRLVWSVSPAGIVQQDGDGIFRAVGNGRAFVVAQIDPADRGVLPGGYWAGNVADTVVIEVQQRAARLTLEPVDSVFGTLGSARQLHARVTDARANAMLELPPLTWLSADSHVVLVASNGLVYSVDDGTTQVFVQFDQLVAQTTFSVNARRPHTSCMVFAYRGTTQQQCVTLDFTLREREASQ
jgi:hypothetical protein